MEHARHSDPEVAALMEQYERVTNNDPVLMIDILEQQRARNRGYPKWLYHETREPVQAINKEQEAALMREMGYKANYIPRNFPAHFFRRNMDPKFEAADLNAGRPGDFIERRSVKDEAAMDALLKERKPKTAIGDWQDSPAKIEPLPDGPTEDPQVTIARQQGELEAMRREQESSGGRRKKQAETKEE